jgi:hypothetical protein
MSQNNKDKQKNFSRRDFVKGAGAGAAAMLGSSAVPSANAQSGNIPEAYNHPGNWDLEADIVIIGSGPTGLVAANRALDAGRSVIIVDANYDVGGHGLMNGGQIHLGGGTAMQKKYGVEDSPDTLFKDLTDWSVLETNGMPDYRYNMQWVSQRRAVITPSGPKDKVQRVHVAVVEPPYTVHWNSVPEVKGPEFY